MKTDASQKPSGIEARLGVAVLVILVIVGGGVYLRQFQINPAVLALRPQSQPVSATDGPAVLVDTSGSDIQPLSAPEHFGPDTLYEKIDGRADLYLSSGFVSLATQRFALRSAAGDWVEMFVFDMATAENAFSVYSMQRREGAEPVDIVPDAYRTPNALFMAHGKFYLECIGAQASEPLERAMDTLARLFLASRGEAAASPATPVPGAGLFPAQDRENESLQLIGANAFGYEQLDRIYTCEYRVGDARLTAFVSDRQNDAAAAALVDSYRKTLLTYGAVAVDPPMPVDGGMAVRLFDTYEIVFSRKHYLAGVHEATDLNAAGNLAGRLAEHLERLK